MKPLLLFVLLITSPLFAQDSITLVPPEEIPVPISPQTSTPAPTQIGAQVGSLHIISGSATAKLYLDGKMVGISECLINDVPVGKHEVFILDGENSSSMEAFTIEGVTRTIKQKTGRETFVNVMSTYSNVWCRGIRAFGPSLDIGIQHKASYYGINFHWAFFNRDYWGSPESDSKGQGFLVGGAGLQWYYSLFNYKNILEIAPGLASGFWYFDGTLYTPRNDSTSIYSYNNETYFEEMFFTGPSVRLSVGYKRVFLSCAYTMLIGTRLGHALVFGTRVVL